MRLVRGLSLLVALAASLVRSSADLAPLRVVSVTPSVNSIDFSHPNEFVEVRISNRQAITISFNFAVIALGSDYGAGPLPDALQPISLHPQVPGRMRWITTSILRFDPDEDWPAELHLTLTLRNQARSYDGRQFAPSHQRKWGFRTPGLRMWIGSVSSARASAATDGRWSATENMKQGFEVPPDGRVQLLFSSDVDASLIKSHVRLRRLSTKGDSTNGREHKLRFGKCSVSSPRCVELRIARETPLDVDGLYALELPKGSSFHSHAGRTGDKLHVHINGLQSFTLPFLERTEWRKPKYRRQRIWLRHGLQNGTSLSDVAAQFDLSPKLSLNLSRPEAAVLQLEAEFEPDTEYSLHVLANSSLKDSFGLPLLSSHCSFRTAKLDSLFLTPDGSATVTMSNASSLTWPVLTRGKHNCIDLDPQVCTHPKHMSIVPVEKSQIKQAIASLGWSPESLHIRGQATAKVSAPLHEQTTVFNMPLSQVLEPSGLALRNVYTTASDSPRLAKHSHFLGVPTLVATLAMASDGVLTVWVLSVADNVPVRGAKVTLYGQERNKQGRMSEITQLASKDTDKNGLANLRLSHHLGDDFGGLDYEFRAVVVEAAGEPILLHTTIPRSYTSLRKPRQKVSLVTDRAVFKPLDDVKLKGYVRIVAPAGVTKPQLGTMYALRIRWTRKRPMVIPVIYDATYGTFATTLKVPADAQYGMTTIELMEGATCSGESCSRGPIGSTTVTVADPRPPTVALKVDDGDGFLPPGGHLTLTLKTHTLSGTPVAGANVKLVWTLKYLHSDDGMGMGRGPAWRPHPLPDDHTNLKDASGEQHFLTGANGSVTVSWRPANLSHAERIGDRFDLHFSWVGPTRERLQKSLKVPVARSRFTLALDVPGETSVLPGFPFAVSATLREHHEFGGARHDVPLEISLYKTESRTVAADDVDLKTLPMFDSWIQKCSKAPCKFTVPNVGYYLVVACTAGGLGGVTLCSKKPVGQAKHEWEESPLMGFLQQVVTVVPDESTYYLGDEPKLTFYNPVPKLRVLVKWGSQLDYKDMVTDAFSVGQSTVTLPALGAECRGGCGVWMFFCAAGNVSRTMPVPTSPLFDIHGPQSTEKYLHLDVKENDAQELIVSIKPDQPIQEPGTKAGFTVSVHNTDMSPVDGEVCVFGVDQAFLNVLPHKPLNLSTEFVFRSIDQLMHTFTHDRLVSPSSLNMSLAYLRKLLKIDPWLVEGYEQWGLRPGGAGWLDMPLHELLAEHTSDLTAMPASIQPMMEERGYVMEDAAPAPMARSAPVPMMMLAKKAGPATSGGATKEPSSVRSNFVVTPLFLPGVIVKSGVAHAHWNLPDNMGSFELRAYAVSKDGKFGGGSIAKQVARKSVSLMPSVPRLARVGDKFKGGVTLTNAESINMDLQVTIHMMSVGAIALDSLGGNQSENITQGIKLRPVETTEVVFPMTAIAIGNASAIVSVSNSEGIIDSLKLDIQVLGVQPEATVATSFAITAKPAPCIPWQEGLALPSAVNGSGKLSFIAGTGRLPAVQNLAVGLLHMPQRPTANDLLCAAGTKAVLMPYARATASLYAKTSEKFKMLPPLLEKLTAAQTGLHYMSSMMGHHPDYPDLQLNAFALYVVRRLRVAGAVLPAPWMRLQAKWQNALSSGLLQYATRAMKHPPHEFTDYETLVACRLALGSTWQPDTRGKSVSNKVQDALSIESLLKAVDSLSVYSKAALCMLLLLPAEPSNDNSGALKKIQTEHSKHIKAILQYLKSLVRVTARTAYVAQSPGSPHAASGRVNSMVLSVLALGEKIHGTGSGEHTDKLADYVARAGANGQSESALFAALALVDYDRASMNLAANVQFGVLTGMTPVFSAHLQSTDDSPSSKELAWSSLSTPPKPLIFAAEGTGEVSVAVSMSFVPAEVSPHSIYRGIDLQKVIQNSNETLGGPDGPPLSSIPLGQVVTVTLQITIVDDLRGVLVEDWLPAGLEALDPNLGSSRDEDTLFRMMCPTWLWWRCTRFQRETRKDRVTFYSSMVFAGTYVLRYQAIAATRGKFMLPPARASVVLEPEVMGLSGGHQLLVFSPNEKVKQIDAEIVKASKPCPSDCNGRGTCDTKTGKCNCNTGCAGLVCSESSKVPFMMPLLDHLHASEPLVFINGDEEVALNVELLSDDKTDSLFPKWLLAGTHLFSDKADGDSPLTVFVNHSQKQIIIKPPERIHRTIATDIMVSASADGNLFASRRLSVKMHPKCYHRSKRWCSCQKQQEKPFTHLVGSQHCLKSGAYGKCKCVATRMSQQKNLITNSDASDGGSTVLIGALIVVAAAGFCFLMNRPKKNSARRTRVAPEQETFLSTQLSTQDQAARQLNRAASMKRAATTDDVDDLAE